MSRTNRAEVAMVECGKLPLSEPLEDRHYGGVDESEPQVGIPKEQFAHARVVGTDEIDDHDHAVLEIGEESRERAQAQAVAREPLELHDDRSRDQQRLKRARKKLGADVVVRVAPVHCGVQRSGIAYQRHERGS